MKLSKNQHSNLDTIAGRHPGARIIRNSPFGPVIRFPSRHLMAASRKGLGLRAAGMEAR